MLFETDWTQLPRKVLKVIVQWNTCGFSLHRRKKEKDISRWLTEKKDGVKKDGVKKGRRGAIVLGWKRIAEKERKDEWNNWRVLLHPEWRA